MNIDDLTDNQIENSKYFQKAFKRGKIFRNNQTGKRLVIQEVPPSPIAVGEVWKVICTTAVNKRIVPFEMNFRQLIKGTYLKENGDPGLFTPLN